MKYLFLFKHCFFIKIINSLRLHFWGAIAEAVGGAASGITSGVLNWKSAEKNRKWQKKVDKFNMQMAQDAFDWQKHAYLNTAGDMSQAGINPAALGNGVNANSVNAQTVNSGVSSTPQLDAQPIASAIQNAAQLDLDKKSVDIQEDAQESNANLQSSQAAKNNQETLNMIQDEQRRVEEENRNKERHTDWKEQREYEKSLREQEEKLRENQSELLVAQAEQAKEQARATKSNTDYWDAVGASPNSNDKFKLVQETKNYVKKVAGGIKHWLDENAEATKDDRAAYDWINTDEGAERLNTYMEQAHRQGLSGEEAEKWAFQQVKDFYKAKREKEK